ncbi:MAG TPA: ATP-dependent sacrificial sulfur transferase LarE [Candidatus Acidoferrales bacterium]|nr:ATP-dependent sacrificial sulfur transferase LarE [Candidatus Acidoferrales bacterium]
MNEVLDVDVTMSDLFKKYDALKSCLGRYTVEGLVVAFSGGVDSGFLLWAAEEARKQYGGILVALTTNSDSMPVHDKVDVEDFVKHAGVRHVWRDSTEVDNPDYIKNDSERCYYCKTELFGIAKKVAMENNCKKIAYGYNASDKTDIRPGHRAAIENDVVFPLAAYDFTKDEIRELMRSHGLKLSDKPSSPCLSSRIMRGVEITKQELRDIDVLEDILREGGMKIFRLRLHELNRKRFLRLEASPDEIALAIQLKDRLVKAAKERGYDWVTLDLEGYKTGGGNA